MYFWKKNHIQSCFLGKKTIFKVVFWQKKGYLKLFFDKPSGIPIFFGKTIIFKQQSDFIHCFFHKKPDVHNVFLNKNLISNILFDKKSNIQHVFLTTNLVFIFFLGAKAFVFVGKNIIFIFLFNKIDIQDTLLGIKHMFRFGQALYKHPCYIHVIGQEHSLPTN